MVKVEAKAEAGRGKSRCEDKGRREDEGEREEAWQRGEMICGLSLCCPYTCESVGVIINHPSVRLTLNLLIKPV